MGLLDNFTLGFVATATLVLRLFMMPFLIYNLNWSFKSFYQFIRGQNFPACVYESMVFFMCAGLTGYNILAFLGRTSSTWTDPHSLVLQCLFFLAVVLATIGKRLALTTNFEKFYWLMSGNNFDVAVRAAQMNEHDSEFTDSVLSTAETTLALDIAKKAMKSESS